MVLSSTVTNFPCTLIALDVGRATLHLMLRGAMADDLPVIDSLMSGCSAMCSSLYRRFVESFISGASADRADLAAGSLTRTLLTLCACLACSTQVFAAPDGPALHENWRNVAYGPMLVYPDFVAEGNDGQHVIVYGRLGLASLNAMTGVQEWHKDLAVYIRDGIFMLRSRPEFVLFGSITDRDLYPGQESHRGWIQVRSYPDG
ncbi:MAG: hypothetical protein J5I53_01620, partial [Bradyrhizobiaceae bacterium]|nr:hypothetical protein [Bradyrhizobiaceae bacterium]